MAAQARGALPVRPAHCRPRAKNVILLFMCGGASHLETFDYKPQLRKWAGKRADDIFSAEELQRNRFHAARGVSVLCEHLSN